jgi:hypothetical protein
MTGYEEQVISSFFAFLIVLIIVIAISAAHETRKSKKYRKFVTDMYVAAKIRFFAKEDNLDLVAEEANFKDWNKRNRKEQREGYDLDNAVEDELIERVDNSTKKDKKEKKEKEDKE